MDKITQLFGKGWEFIVSPPQEVVQATIQLGKDLADCGVQAFTKYGTTLLEAIKGVF